MISLKTQYSISNIWRFWLPVLFFVTLLFIFAIAPDFYHNWMDGELGVIENIQVILLLGGFILAVKMLPDIRAHQPKWLFIWVLTAALCCLYVLVEEISFGQHFIGWEVEGYWAQINDQQETNLHNTSSWFDQKPRLILLIGVIFGGMIMPLLQKHKPGLLPEKYNLIYPSGALFYVALLALLCNIADDIHKLSDHLSPFFGRASEVEEALLYYFVLLYLIMLRQRLKST
ncbi:MAG: hypothetical protein ACQEQL_07495 [Pseudomonadota bacterium]